MTITFDIAPDIEGRLEEKAVRSGLPVPDYVRHLVEDDVADARGPSKRGTAVLAVLDSFMMQGAQEHQDTLATLRKALDEDRPGQRRLFGTGLNPVQQDER